MKRELLWDPCLDLVGNRLPNCFVDRRAGSTRGETKRIAALAVGLVSGEGVVLYPEGTRFSEHKRDRVLQRLQRQGDPELLRCAEALHHVLPPRTAGALALIDSAPEADVVFFAHTGFEGASSFADIFQGTMIGSAVRARYWATSAESIPRDSRERKRWLFGEWQKVESIVADWSSRNNEHRLHQHCNHLQND